MSEAKKRKNTGKVTLADVAKLAGVGSMTVSRTLRTPEQVSDKLRDKIEKAINVLGYRPNLAASSLASAATNNLVAVITPKLTESGLNKLWDGLQKVLRQEEYATIWVEASYYHHKEEMLLSSLSGYNLAAIILINMENSPSIYEWLTTKNIPIISIGATENELVDINIGVDNMQAMYALTKKVIKTGYKNIALLCANQGHKIFQQRIQGWHKALLEHHMSPHRVINAAELPSFSVGSRLLPEFILNWPEIDALVCSSDELACGALYECQRRRIAVPRELAVVGFGDSEFSRVCNPPLTTVTIPYFEIGIQAGLALLQQLKPEKKYEILDLPTIESQIKIRDSL